MAKNAIDPIDDLMELSCGIGFMAESFYDKGDYGPFKLLDTVSKELMSIANHMDDEGWKAPEPKDGP